MTIREAISVLCVVGFSPRFEMIITLPRTLSHLLQVREAPPATAGGNIAARIPDPMRQYFALGATRH